MERTVEQQVRKILIEQLGVSDDEVTPTSRIYDDLGADSLDAVDITMAVEERFTLDIPDEDMGQWQTVGDIVAYIEKRRAQ